MVPFAEEHKKKLLTLVPGYSVKDAGGGDKFYVSYNHRTRGAAERSLKLIDLHKPWEFHGSCCIAHQFKFPCQHYWAALLSKPKEEQLEILKCNNDEEMHEKLFHRAYIMKNVRAALEGVEVCIPCIDDVAHDGATGPPPQHKH